ncbi:MAG: kynureninase [Proteobacteria bacterium]|nr:kynureninase [Pseudomonadota bacterium]
MKKITLEKVREMDRIDPFRGKREEFLLPEGIIYLDGNSLGALPKAVRLRIRDVTENEWGQSLIAGWDKHGWVALPGKVGDKIARLIGAKQGEVVVTESTSINLFKAVTAALQVGPKRGTILTEKGNFPADLYVLDAIARESGGKVKIKRVAREDLIASLTDEIAILCLTHANYKTSVRHDMAALTRRAREAGAMTIWDLSHSAGALPVDLNGCGADFAIGCGYKFLNGGPGGSGYIFVAARHQNKILPALAGWMGHVRPFDFSSDYQPVSGIARQLTGTPFVIGAAALDAALEVFDGVDMEAVGEKAGKLGDLFIGLVEAECPEMKLACPREATGRTSQVTFTYPEAQKIMAEVVKRGVVADFRPPDVMRFGLAPLYNSYEDVYRAVLTLKEIFKQ